MVAHSSLRETAALQKEKERLQRMLALPIAEADPVIRALLEEGRAADVARYRQILDLMSAKPAVLVAAPEFSSTPAQQPPLATVPEHSSAAAQPPPLARAPAYSSSPLLAAMPASSAPSVATVPSYSSAPAQQRPLTTQATHSTATPQGPLPSPGYAAHLSVVSESLPELPPLPTPTRIPTHPL